MPTVGARGVRDGSAGADRAGIAAIVGVDAPKDVAALHSIDAGRSVALGIACPVQDLANTGRRSGAAGRSACATGNAT